MKTNLMMCVPGYPVSGDSAALTPLGDASRWGARVQRQRYGHVATAVKHAQIVLTNPGSMSALSFVPRT